MDRKEFAQWIYQNYTINENPMAREMFENILEYADGMNKKEQYDYCRRMIPQIPESIIRQFVYTTGSAATIYIIILDWANHGEFGVEIRNSYNDYDMALEEMKNIIEGEKENWDENDEDTVIEESDSSWEAYENGRYDAKHTKVYIAESELI